MQSLAVGAESRVTETLAEQRRAIERRAGRRAALAGSLGEVGDVLRDAGEADPARIAYAEALALWRDIGNQQRAGKVDQRLARLEAPEAVRPGSR